MTAWSVQPVVPSQTSMGGGQGVVGGLGGAAEWDLFAAGQQDLWQVGLQGRVRGDEAHEGCVPARR